MLLLLLLVLFSVFATHSFSLVQAAFYLTEAVCVLREEIMKTKPTLNFAYNYVYTAMQDKTM